MKARSYTPVRVRWQGETTCGGGIAAHGPLCTPSMVRHIGRNRALTWCRLHCGTRSADTMSGVAVCGCALTFNKERWLWQGGDNTLRAELHQKPKVKFTSTETLNPRCWYTGLAMLFMMTSAVPH